MNNYSTHLNLVLIFKAQVAYYEIINLLSNKLFNNYYLLSLLASQVNQDALYFYQVIQSEDSDFFIKLYLRILKLSKKRKFLISFYSKTNQFANYLSLLYSSLKENAIQ